MAIWDDIAGLAKGVVGGAKAGPAGMMAGAAEGFSGMDEEEGGLGGLISSALGTKNKYQMDQAAVDANAFNYGGRPGGADAAAQGYESQGQALGSRDNAAAMARGNMARRDQGHALALQKQAAMGQAPSRAELLGKAQADQAASSQQSLAASARGPAAMALAQQNAAANTANAQTQIAQGAMANRAGEMADARNSYQAGATGMRSADLAGRGLDQANQQSNDQARLAYDQMGANVRGQQLQAQQNQQQLQSQNYNTKHQVQSGIAQANAGAAGGAMGGLLGAASSILPMIPSDERGKSSYRGRGGFAGADVGESVESVRGLGERSLNLNNPVHALLANERAAQQARYDYGDSADDVKGYYGGTKGDLTGLSAAEVAKQIADRDRSQAARDVASAAQATGDDIRSGNAVRAPNGSWLKLSAIIDKPKGSESKSSEPKSEEKKRAGVLTALSSVLGGAADKFGSVPPSLHATPTQMASLNTAYQGYQPTIGSDEKMKDSISDFLGGGWFGDAMGEGINTGMQQQMGTMMGGAAATPSPMGMGGANPLMASGAPITAGIQGAGMSAIGSLLSDEKSKKEAMMMGRAEGMLKQMEASMKAPTAVARQGLGDKADDMMAGMRANMHAPTAVQTASGRQFPSPPPHAMEQYLQSTRGGMYEYKDPSMPGAQPGPNFGPPSAQDMASNPIGRVITTHDPSTGMMGIDKDKALKANMSATSYVNDKLNGIIEGAKQRQDEDFEKVAMNLRGRR